MGVLEFRFLLTGLSSKSRFAQAVAEDGPVATDAQARNALADM